MGIFNHIHVGEKEKGDSAGIINFGLLAAEYVRQEQMVNYPYKRRHQTNILRSILDMGNNNITKLKEPSGPKDSIPKRFLFKYCKSSDDYKLVDFSAMGSENKNAIKAIQEKIKDNRQAFQMELNSLQNELETMIGSLKTNINSNESEIMTKLRGDIRQGVESLRGAFEKIAKKKKKKKNR